METIEFNYVYADDDSDDMKEIRSVKCDKGGLDCESVCEAFVDFMETVGFNITNIYKFFEE